jgi:hypothetical protein
MRSKGLAHLQGVLEARQAELENLLRNREVITVNLSADMPDQIRLPLCADSGRTAPLFVLEGPLFSGA